MKNLFTCLALLVLIPTLAFATALPFKNQDELKEQLEAGQPANCPGGQQGMQLDTKDLPDGSWYRVDILNGRFLAILVSKDGQPTRLWFGHMETFNFVVDEELTIAEAQVKYPDGPCQWLTKESA